MAGFPPDATLPVRWRATTHVIALRSLQPPTVGGLKAALATMTGVPAGDQTLLLPRPPGGGRGGGGGHADAVPLANVFTGGLPSRPVAMMGAPATAAAADGGTASGDDARGGGGGGGSGDAGRESVRGDALQALHDRVIDDLDDVQAPPPAPPARQRLPIHPFYSRRASVNPPLRAHSDSSLPVAMASPAPPSLDGSDPSVAVEPPVPPSLDASDADVDDWYSALRPASRTLPSAAPLLPYDERTGGARSWYDEPTNGAWLSVEAMTDLMAGAAAGAAFTPALHRAQLASPGYPPERPAEGATLPPRYPVADLDAADAVAAEMDASRTLPDAIRASRSPAALLTVLLTGAGPHSNTFLRSLTAAQLRSLRPGILFWGCDLSPRDDAGAGLLQRLGLHALPAVVVLADVGGGGMGVVDMFDPTFVGFDAVSDRLASSEAALGGFLDHTRARMAAVTDREELLAEQDAAYEEAAAADAAAADAAAASTAETPAATTGGASPVAAVGADAKSQTAGAADTSAAAVAADGSAATDAGAATAAAADAAAVSAADAAAAAAVSDARSRLTPPPPAGLGVAAVALRLPGGRRVVRTFWAGEPLGRLWDWALVEAAAEPGVAAAAAAAAAVASAPRWVLVRVSPRRVYRRGGEGTVGDAGLLPRAALVVEVGDEQEGEEAAAAE